MFDLFFPLTLAFLAYVGYDAFQAVKRAERGEPVFKPARAAPPPAPKPAPAVKAATPVPAPAPVKAAPAPAKSAAVKAAPAAKPTPAAKPALDPNLKLADELRNPATGEISAVPGNYRFAKKWIKDALVSEKLLDRVYKPNELDDATSRKVKDAIDQLRAIKKYQA
jgi:hypothetical protein